MILVGRLFFFLVVIVSVVIYPVVGGAYSLTVVIVGLIVVIVGRELFVKEGAATLLTVGACLMKLVVIEGAAVVVKTLVGLVRILLEVVLPETKSGRIFVGGLLILLKLDLAGFGLSLGMKLEVLSVELLLVGGSLVKMTGAILVGLWMVVGLVIVV